ncbi:MAG TPA: ABC transporter permease [Firmicutes bacterium]|nr:ABC transporter permease [Bacillota bacterium]
MWGKLSPLLWVVLWEMGSRMGILDQRFFSAPSKVALSFIQLTLSGELVANVVATLWRVALGFALGAVPGVVLGMGMGLFRILRELLEPTMSLAFPLPKLALFPLILLIFGIGDTSKAIIVAVGVFFLVLFNSMTGVLTIDENYLNVARSFKATKLDMFWTVAFPGALPMIFTGLRLGMGTAMLLIVSAEFVGARTGIGYMIWESWDMFDIERMFVGLIVTAGIGYALNASIRLVERMVMPWRG